MITFDFWCPIESKVSTATADPVALVFGGAPDLSVYCQGCETYFIATVTQTPQGSALELREDVPNDEDEDDTIG